MWGTGYLGFFVSFSLAHMCILFLWNKTYFRDALAEYPRLMSYIVYVLG